jgi:chaperone required for assembly of F1-ATPase
MTDWTPKRFWKAATAAPCEGGYHITLDGRNVKTPAKAALIVPTLPMAQAIAAEWDAQTGKIDPMTMPCTRSANAAIDKVAHQRDEVINLLAEYGGTDLLCYRASEPEGLIAAQQAAWDPVLDWAQQTYGITLVTGQGVMHIAQPQAALARLRAELAGLDDFALAAAHDLIALSGSLLLALAVMRGHLSAADAWNRSRVDEDWQIAQWGADDEATALTATKRAAFLHADHFYRLARG